VCAFILTKLMCGSLIGGGLTGMITCLSPSARNGDESYMSLKYSKGMADLTNKPKPQPAVPLAKMAADARRGYEKSAAIVARGVVGKYQAKREAEVNQWRFEVEMLKGFGGGSR